LKANCKSKIPLVDLHAQYLTIKDEIDTAIQTVINESAFVRGHFVHDFEEQFAEKLGISHCIGVGNGTDALYIALRQLGIGSGDEVITTAHSWISTAEVISQTGAKPVFIDTEPDFFTINPELIPDKISPNTKAIIPVHLYGQPADMHLIMDICQDHDLFLVEDCAQAHFSQYHGRNVGTFGDVATFSFYPGKNLGAYGDAGSIVTNDDSLAEKMRRFANHGSLLKHDHKVPGINSRLDGLQAAILAVKLQYIDKWNQDRNRIANIYSSKLSNLLDVIVPQTRLGSKPVFHIYALLTAHREGLRKYLNELGIETGIHYPIPLPLLEAYSTMGYSEKDISIAFSHSQKLLSLPIYPELTRKSQEFIMDNILDYFLQE
jgi:dTDP-4-amino-4,6-dideoxygalactose transaminase